ncbi:MAG: hypothetical protein ABSF38_01605 [Verrucomicrobiota bacterium]
MSPADWKELGWLLMLMPLGVVLGIGGFFVNCALRRRRLPDPFPAGDPDGDFPDAAKFGFHSFLPPSRWLAVKSANASAVLAALRLQHVAPCSWEDGLREAGADKLFVSPPICGWVLVVGSGLPEPAEDVDFCYRFLKDLSLKLGNVQFFSVNRVLNHHAWALLDGGRVFRAYAWAGQTLWNEGLVTAAEKDLEMVCFDYGSEVNAFLSREALSGDADKLNQLAARWSLDPAALPRATWEVHGIVGEF